MAMNEMQCGIQNTANIKNIEGNRKAHLDGGTSNLENAVIPTRRIVVLQTLIRPCGRSIFVILGCLFDQLNNLQRY